VASTCYVGTVPEWIPTTASAKGRLALTALEYFAAHGYGDIGVTQLSAAAGVTTGALYHHFGSKLGLYDVARAEVERRVLDRLQGAVEARAGDSPAAAAKAALLVAFDFLAQHGSSRLLAEAHPSRQHDPIEEYVASVSDRRGIPVGAVLVAAWRAALRAMTDGVPSDHARAAFAAINVEETARP
jgi:AcrR family transcriptional regulator